MTDQTELRALALKATPGPWWYQKHGGRHRILSGSESIAHVPIDWQNRALDNAAYIAAANPAAVLAMLDERQQLQDALAAAREALRPFVEEFERRREEYLRRGERSIMEGNFDRMPDHWPMAKMLITMGDCRAARAALPQARAEGEGRNG